MVDRARAGGACSLDRGRRSFIGGGGRLKGENGA